MNSIFNNVYDQLNDSNSAYFSKFKILTREQRDYCINFIFETIVNGDTSKAGVHRKDEWNTGWKENYLMSTYKPRYFGKYPVIRLGGDLVLSTEEDSDFEYKTLCALENCIFKKYLLDAKNIYEFGCGTGHNLLRVSTINPTAKLVGLDWSDYAVKNVSTITNSVGCKFNMFSAEPEIEFETDSVIFTVASMEQLGINFHNFTDYLLANKNNIKYIVHIEPLIELLDKDNLLDNLCIKYCEMRNYLKGYVSYIKHLEKIGKAKIIECARTYVGSLFIEGYSLLVWKPL